MKTSSIDRSKLSFLWDFDRINVMRKAAGITASCALLTGCEITRPDGTKIKPDPKTVQALRGAVETIGAAAAQQAIREIAAQQEN